MKTLAIAAIALLTYTCGAIKVVDFQGPVDEVNVLMPVKDSELKAREELKQVNWKKNRERDIKKEADTNAERERQAKEDVLDRKRKMYAYYTNPKNKKAADKKKK